MQLSNTEQATTLCTCVNTRYAVKGWEPEVLQKLRSGEKDWRMPALIQRVGKAIQSCQADYKIKLILVVVRNQNLIICITLNQQLTKFCPSEDYPRMLKY